MPRFDFDGQLKREIAPSCLEKNLQRRVIHQTFRTLSSAYLRDSLYMNTIVGVNNQWHASGELHRRPALTFGRGVRHVPH